ncbi:carbon-nitrogen hydrolase [Diaporthe sp. PMI_573]|nr:carbon-nitrogen hydrolase [Diaporthaceae sp. PMI_573]
MKIGCLQFSPRLGEVGHNLNRADATLAKVRRDDLDSLDLLVVPELAFSGSGFRSLSHVSPLLEYSDSGITALWARTVALKHRCTVVVGYPEKPKDRKEAATALKAYNSAIIINPEGNKIGNYRKRFLHSDESWASEGDRFSRIYIPGLRRTTLGLCIPYKFKTPLHAFEFAFHVLDTRANVVIISMAWYSDEDPKTFSRLPQEPDFDTLNYWVQRLGPVIRAEVNEETIVVFCNRAGVEGDLAYAGTSAVVGIKGGEVRVYGLLGRGQNTVLFVDTDKEPIGKLLYRPFGGLAECSSGARLTSKFSNDRRWRANRGICIGAIGCHRVLD